MDADEMERLLEFLRVPSISASAEHAADVSRAAQMVAAEIGRAGAQAEVRTTRGQPLVLGEVPASTGDPGAPRVLIYGHYDVQPPGDAGLWTTPAFEPTVRDGNLYARGASDDKGNLFMLIAAVQRMVAAGTLPVRVSFVVDGEEECGGHSAVDHLGGPEAAGARACIIFDSPMVAPGRPALCTGVRGLVGRRVRVTTAEGDGHSGIYGGAALSAAHVLVRILSAVSPIAGRLPEALYAGLAPAGAAEVAAWADLPPGARMLADAGLRPADEGASEGFYMRTLAGASVDVHAIRCGDPTAIATIVPGYAEATLSLRLAPGQDAERMAAVFDALLIEAAPPEADVAIDDLGVALPAVLDPAHPVLTAAARGIERATGWPVAPVRLGGTLPVVATLAAAGIPTILTGFGLPTDRTHSPDEHIRVENLEVGTRAAMRMMEELGAL
jgi:acetylornithine deacetylase/succinyl-diaminopimelate desuccinylase-like protein